LITDVFGLRLRLCTIHSQNLPFADCASGIDKPRANRLTWDIRVF